MPRQRRTRTRTEAPRPRVAGPWKHGPIPVLGLIGGIGAGKTRVAAMLAEHGAFVIDADAVGHALLDQRPVRDQVVARFGKEILRRTPDTESELEGSAEAETSPTIDRRALGAIVFAAPTALRQLEAILHPKMRQTFERAIARTIRRGRARAVVLDAAILLEAGWDSLCDRIVFVDAPHDLRLARLSSLRGWSEEALARREAAQWPLDRKRDRADIVVLNNDDTRNESLAGEIRRVVDTLFPRLSGATQAGSVVASSPGSNRGPLSPPSGDPSRSRSGFGSR